MSPVRNAAAAVALLAGLGATIGVPAALGSGLPDDGPVPLTDGRLDVGSGVTLTPPPGARLRLDDSRPGGDEVVLTTGGTTITVRTVLVPHRPRDFVAHTRHKFQRDDGLLAGPVEPWRLAGGVLGERGDLRVVDRFADGRPGCYGIAVAEGVGVVAVVSPVDGCRAVPDATRAALDTLTFEPQEQP